ncbi:MULTISPECIES: universal stress protein [Salinibaculum]|uniref:universal stress protein n=1 Tax=Salinibaculum TaxID=2732368 RepID=UPI0030D1EA63
MTILVAVADDPMRERVLDVGLDLGRGLGQDLYVLHLVNETSADSDARRIRDEVREYVTGADVAVTVSVEQISHTGARSGPRTAQELLDAAADVHISHIVMGHTSKGLLGNLKDGSTAFAVADSAEIPVTIVPSMDQ